MKGNAKDKKNIKGVKLPQINTHKTSSSFATESMDTSSSGIRPNSSSKVGELQKNLFSQLDQYEEMGKKPLRKIKTKKQIESTKDSPGEWAVDLEVPYLKKLEKIMPQTYHKLIESKKLEAPLKQNNNLNLKKNSSVEQTEKNTETISAELSKKNINAQNYPKEMRSTQLSQRSSLNLSHSRSKSKKSMAPSSPKRESSFAVAEREVQMIYQQYLEEEGLTEMNEITCSDLKELNNQICQTQLNLNSVQKDMYEIIKKFGSEMIFERQ